MDSTSRYSWFPLFFLWLGASISVAEIYTGGAIAEAGPLPGLIAIITGHLLGVLLLALMAYIGYSEKKPAIMCSRLSFGVRGSWLLSAANVVQLVGWTAVMLQQSGQAMSLILQTMWGIENSLVPVIVVMGILVALWTLWDRKGNFTVNNMAVLLLTSLCLLVSWVLFGQIASGPVATRPATMPFSLAFELSLIMPLSWVPLVADYASRAKKVSIAVFAPATGYFIGSVWMYCIGFAGALYTGEANPSPMLLAAGFGVSALGVVALSTISTTFLDVYSSVASAQNIATRLPFRTGALATVGIGTVMALFWSYEVYESFLLYIGAIFAPLSAVMFADFFVLRQNHSARAISAPGLVSLCLGMAVHALAAHFQSPLGPTVSCLAFTFCFHIGLRLVWGRKEGKNGVFLQE